MAKSSRVKLTNFRNNLSDYCDKIEKGEISSLHITRYGETIFTIKATDKIRKSKRKLGTLKKT